MGVTKSELFTPAQNEIAAYARVFAHPARVAILQVLLRSDTCCNSLLVGDLGLAQATISQHLKELKSIGIIQGTIEGVSVNYCIDPDKWSEVRSVFSALFESFTAPNCGPNC